MNNGLAGIIIGGYLLIIALKGKSPELLAVLSDEGDFLRWGVAVLLVIGIAKSGLFGDAGDTFVLMTFLALGMIVVSKVNPNIADDFSQIFKLRGQNK